MSDISLTSYSKEDLSYALRLLRNYKNTYNQIGKRAKFFPSSKSEKAFRIQHTDNISQEEITRFASLYISQFFSEVKDPKITYEINNDITGGMRLFYGDDMIDISFQKFSQLISF